MLGCIFNGGKAGANGGRYGTPIGAGRSSGRERAGWIPPEGGGVWSGRYRLALACVGRCAGARGGRERGGVLASACAGERGEAGVTWRVFIDPRGLSLN
jgi:hypothetical protein